MPPAPASRLAALSSTTPDTIQLGSNINVPGSAKIAGTLNISLSKSGWHGDLHGGPAQSQHHRNNRGEQLDDRAARPVQVAPAIAASNTKNYTGATGIVGLTVGPTIAAGATGTLSAWNGEILTLANNSTSMAVTNAYGITVNNFVTAGGVGFRMRSADISQTRPQRLPAT